MRPIATVWFLSMTLLLSAKEQIVPAEKAEDARMENLLNQSEMQEAHPKWYRWPCRSRTD